MSNEKELSQAKVWIVVRNINGKKYRHSGCWGRRIEAKAGHAAAYHPTCSPYVFGKELSALQKKAWDECYARGDRVVRALIVWEE